MQASRDENDEDLGLDSLFPEPPQPPTPEPTTAVYQRAKCHVKDETDWTSLNIRLVGSHSLWGHYLWNAARSFAAYLDSHRDLYANRDVLELGAGGGLPSLVAIKNGSRKVVITDYPDKSLIENISRNVTANVLDPDVQARVSVQGYIWGRDVRPLLDAVQTPTSSGFDLIILSDLIFNHSQHDALLRTCEWSLKQSSATTTSAALDPSATPPSNISPCVLAFYTHHRPHLRHRDMQFLIKAQERGWTCEEIVTELYPPMFPEDSGEESIRATVHGWRITRSTIVE